MSKCYLYKEDHPLSYHECLMAFYHNKTVMPDYGYRIIKHPKFPGFVLQITG